MFVARVLGDALAPEVDAGTYCVFEPLTGERDGRILLVFHTAITDPLTGGQYTLRRYRSERQQTDAGSVLRVQLEAVRPGVLPLVLTPKDEDEIHVVAGLIHTLGGHEI
jgi:hypothetical protein